MCTGAGRGERDEAATILSLLYPMHGIAEEDGARELVSAARRIDRSLVPLVLSVLECDLAAFGPASCDELARARTRWAHFASLARSLTARTGAVVMKGPVLAGLYPSWLLRSYGDLDLVLRDERALWRAARLVADEQPVDRVDISLIGGRPRHAVVTMEWASTDPLIDPPYRVELATAALVGDFRTVPVRPVLPTDQATASLLAIAEERFQRQLHARDVLDVLMLDRARLPPAEILVESIVEYRLGPEVDELLQLAASHVPLGRFGEVLDRLPPVVNMESDRRGSCAPVVAGPTVPDRLGAGQVVYGMPLGPVERRDQDEAILQPFSHGQLLRTSFGDYLLTGGATVSQDAYDAAIAALPAG